MLTTHAHRLSCSFTRRKRLSVNWPLRNWPNGIKLISFDIDRPIIESIVFILESIPELEKIILPLFSGVENKELTVKEYLDHPMQKEHLQVSFVGFSNHLYEITLHFSLFDFCAFIFVRLLRGSIVCPVSLIVYSI